MSVVPELTQHIVQTDVLVGHFHQQKVLPDTGYQSTYHCLHALGEDPRAFFEGLSTTGEN